MESKKFTDAINGQQEKLEKYGLNLVQWCLIQPYLKLKFKEKEDMPVNHINLKILYYQELSSYKISTKYFHYKKKYYIISHYIILYYFILNYIILHYIIFNRYLLKYRRKKKKISLFVSLYFKLVKLWMLFQMKQVILIYNYHLFNSYNRNNWNGQIIRRGFWGKVYIYCRAYFVVGYPRIWFLIYLIDWWLGL
jgi:hypothetical protein